MMHFAAAAPSATVPLWVALVAAAIGATGAVAAQIVAGLVAGRRERVRLEFDRSRALTQDQMAREAAFRDTRRAAFVQLLNNIFDRRLSLWVVVHQWLRDKDYEAIANYVEDDREPGLQTMLLLRDIDLIAPAVLPAASEVADALDSFQIEVTKFNDTDDYYAFLRGLSGKELTLKDEMRRSLGVAI